MELLFARRGAAARQVFGAFAASCVCLFARQRLWCLATVLTIHDCWIFTLHESWSQCDQRKCGRKASLAIASAVAAIAQLGERQTEDLKVPGWIPGLGKCIHLRAEPNGFRVHLLSRSDTVSCRPGLYAHLSPPFAPCVCKGGPPATP